MIQPRALGRGLASLIPRSEEKAEVTDSPYREVPIELIGQAEMQPRKYFDEEQIAELARSIESKGILQPLIVKRVGDRFEVISGARRFKAAEVAGLKKVPVIIRDVAQREQFELALIENLQRADLDPIEEAAAYSELVERFSLTQEDIASEIGRSRSAITNSLRLLRLPDRLKDALRGGEITTGHAKVLVNEPIDRQLFFLDLITKKGLTVNALEGALRTSRGRPVAVRKRRGGVELDVATMRIMEELRTGLGTKVEIAPDRSGGGKIIISYYSQEQLDGLYHGLTGLYLTRRKTGGGI